MINGVSFTMGTDSSILALVVRPLASATFSSHISPSFLQLPIERSSILLDLESPNEEKAAELTTLPSAHMVTFDLGVFKASVAVSEAASGGIYVNRSLNFESCLDPACNLARGILKSNSVSAEGVLHGVDIPSSLGTVAAPFFRGVSMPPALAYALASARTRCTHAHMPARPPARPHTHDGVDQ